MSRGGSKCEISPELSSIEFSLRFKKEIIIFKVIEIDISTTYA